MAYRVHVNLVAHIVFDEVFVNGVFFSTKDEGGSFFDPEVGEVKEDAGHDTHTGKNNVQPKQVVATPTTPHSVLCLLAFERAVVVRLAGGEYLGSGECGDVVGDILHGTLSGHCTHGNP